MMSHEKHCMQCTMTHVHKPKEKSLLLSFYGTQHLVTKSICERNVWVIISVENCTRACARCIVCVCFIDTLSVGKNTHTQRPKRVSRNVFFRTYCEVSHAVINVNCASTHLLIVCRPIFTYRFFGPSRFGGILNSEEPEKLKWTQHAARFANT